MIASSSETPPASGSAGPASEPDLGGGTAQQLKSYIERIERLTEEKDGIATDIRDIYAEAKGNGFDVKIMRKIVSLRRMDNHDRLEQDELLELYKAALGMA